MSNRSKEVYVESLGTKKEEDDFGSMVESVIVGRVVYLMGGTNWMTGQQFPRGYFLSVGPETRGDGFVSTILGSGYKALIKPAARFSQKELDALVCMAPDAGSENVPPGEVVVGNLEKIVRAVNAHDELVQALRDARMLLMMNRAVAGSATMTRINNAIAKAQEVLR